MESEVYGACIRNITTLAGALAAAKGIAARKRNGGGEPRSLHSYHTGLQ